MSTQLVPYNVRVNKSGNINCSPAAGYTYYSGTVSVTCGTTESVTVVTCSGGGGNCSNSATFNIPPTTEPCGSNPGGAPFAWNSGDYQSQARKNLNCSCNDSDASFENLGGCSAGGWSDSTCPETDRTLYDDCGNPHPGECGQDCPTANYNECSSGTCICTYECPTCSSGYGCQGEFGGNCNVDCGDCPNNCYYCSGDCCQTRNTPEVKLTGDYSDLNGTSYEIGDSAEQTFKLRFRRGYYSSDRLGTIRLYLKKVSDNSKWLLAEFDSGETSSCPYKYLDGIINDYTVISSSTASFTWVPETFLNDLLGDPLMAISDCESAPNSCTDFTLYYESDYSYTPGGVWNADYSADINYGDFKIVDEVRAGCTDSLATGDADGNGAYNSDATSEDGSCIYVGCVSSLGNGCSDYAYNDVCDGVDNTLNNSFPCNGANSYSKSDITDDGSCIFPPVVVVNHDPISLMEATYVTVTANASEPAQSVCSTNYNPDYSSTILSYTWNITDSEENDFSVENSLNQPTIGFMLPLYEGIDEGGGGIIYFDLTIENTEGLTASTPGTPINIGDVDIIGTELSSFDSIYIPGGDAYTLIGCYLPPNDNGYDFGTLLDSSFYNVATNPEDGGNLLQGTFTTGDVAYVLTCIDTNCVEDSESRLNGFFNYITGIGWVGPSDINLVPGMGIKLQTHNAGWFRWTQ